MAAAESDPDLAAADTDLEFLYSNDSWYSVRLVLHADMLTVKYRDFPDIYDERFVPGGFKNADEVKRFRERFRPASLQLQDCECSKVERGMKVCASYSFKDDDVRFQDAIVEEVEFKKHAFRNGEEECLCIFMLSWLHGPKVGTMTATSVANICTLQSSANTNQTLNSFLNITMEKMKATLLTSDSDSKKGGDNGHLRSTAQAFEEIISNSWPKIEQDVDMGGETSLMNRITGYHHFVLIDNLEKDLSPRIVVEFIHKQTTISTQVCIFPSLSSETYTRGTIVSDCKENLEKLLKFLENPNHIITSSTGRPWVITEKIPRHGLFRTLIGNLNEKSLKKLQSRNTNCKELKLCHFGTKEYMTAKQLRDLFVEFADHQQRMHKKLALEERKILHMSHPDSLIQAKD